LLHEGKVVAIKGLGGFHLACDATNDKAVGELRGRKYRENKPFALMASSLETIREYCEVSSEEEELLVSWKRPIVLLNRKAFSPISEKVAPNNPCLGFMLPYTPLHYLLFQGPISVLVMTSGNISDEPIAYENKEAMSRLKNIADYFLLHNRDVHIRCDDSVTRISPPGPLDGEPRRTSAVLRGEHLTGTVHSEMVVRRSRGYVPSPLRIPFSFGKEILACGAQLKNTFALAEGDQVFVSHHIGDLENLETLQAFEKGIEHFRELFDIEPVIIAHDLHPEYLSTQYAKNLQTLHPELHTIPIQHHHAHIASCLADNGVSNRKVIGVAFDGTGFGSDGNIWGGEFLIADYVDFQRVAHLKYIPLPGGEQAIKEPWRMAATYLYQVFGPEFLQLDLDFIARLDKQNWKVLERMIEQGINSPLVSSMGRLFDAVSSLLGLRDRVTYQGQAAVELEMVIEQEPGSKLEGRSYGYEIENGDQINLIDPGPIIKGVLSDLQKGVSISCISAKFHNTVVEIIVDLCKRINKTEGLNEVALSGGVFQNMFLLSRAFKRLSREKFRVYLHHRVPTNDGGISLGQAVVANAKSQSSTNSSEK
jgi:hydrogenase maturation protein HypF